METIKVFIVSDNRADILLIKDLLAHDPQDDVTYETEVAKNFQHALRDMVNDTHDVYLVDYRVPGTSVTGIDLIRKVYAGGCTSPALLLTSIEDPIITHGARRAGAADVIHKRYDLCPHPDCPVGKQEEAPRRMLRRCIRYALEQHQEQQITRQQLDAVQAQLIDLNKKLTKG
jgi:CheY-like chemotaxis protein